MKERMEERREGVGKQEEGKERERKRRTRMIGIIVKTYYIPVGST